MRYTPLFLLFAFACLLQSCCRDDDHPSDSQDGRATRAVMVYMAGDNSLGADMYVNGEKYNFLRDDLSEIIEGSRMLADSQRLFVFVDSVGKKSDEGKPFIAEIRKGIFDVKKQYDADFYSSDPAKFREIIKWMTDNVAADSYGLVLWGHATGWMVETNVVGTSSATVRRKAYGLDNGNGGAGSVSKWMNITQMRDALEGLPKFDFILADCCNMICAEVAYELRHAARYLIGSPAEIPAFGAPYDQILPCLYEEKEDMYRHIIDKYYDFYLNFYQQHREYNLPGYSVPLAVVDTDHMEALATATSSILDSCMANYPQTMNVDSVSYYFCYDAPVMYDMRAVLKRNAQKKDFEQWDSIFQKAVPYRRMSMQWQTIYDTLYYGFWYVATDEHQYGCMSMYLPMPLMYYDSGHFKYNTTNSQYAWNQVMAWNRFGW